MYEATEFFYDMKFRHYIKFYEVTEFFYDIKFWHYIKLDLCSDSLGSENITESYSVRILGTETNSVRHPLGRSKKFCPAAFGLGAEFF